jgi:hypothetical protein
VTRVFSLDDLKYKTSLQQVNSVWFILNRSTVNLSFKEKLIWVIVVIKYIESYWNSKKNSDSFWFHFFKLSSKKRLIENSPFSPPTFLWITTSKRHHKETKKRKMININNRCLNELKGSLIIEFFSNNAILITKNDADSSEFSIANYQIIQNCKTCLRSWKFIWIWTFKVECF